MPCQTCDQRKNPAQLAKRCYEAGFEVKPVFSNGGKSLASLEVKAIDTKALLRPISAHQDPPAKLGFLYDRDEDEQLRQIIRDEYPRTGFRLIGSKIGAAITLTSFIIGSLSIPIIHSFVPNKPDYMYIGFAAIPIMMLAMFLGIGYDNKKLYKTNKPWDERELEQAIQATKKRPMLP